MTAEQNSETCLKIRTNPFTMHQKLHVRVNIQKTPTFQRQPGLLLTQEDDDTEQDGYQGSGGEAVREWKHLRVA